MKIKLTWIALVFGLVLKAGAQDLVYYQAGPQTFSFSGTIKYAAPGTFEVNPETNKYDKNNPAFESTLETTNKDGLPTKTVFTSSAVVKTARYDNAALLNEVKDDLLGGTISGWSLVVYTEGESLQIYARKKVGAEFEEVPLGTAAPSEGLYSGTYTETTSFTYDSDGIESGSTVTRAGKYAFEGGVQVDINGNSFVGYVTETGSEYAWYPDKNDKSYQESIYLSAGGKITGGIGSVSYTVPETPASPLSGQTFDAIFLATGTLGKSSAIKIVEPF